MALVVSGLLNKRIAAELGISEITVKAHRGQVKRKMRVVALAELVRAIGALACRSLRASDTKVSTYTIVQ
jgi:FixJ family two-component response regulator